MDSHIETGEGTKRLTQAVFISRLHVGAR